MNSDNMPTFAGFSGISSAALEVCYVCAGMSLLQIWAYQVESQLLVALARSVSVSTSVCVLISTNFPSLLQLPILLPYCFLQGSPNPPRLLLGGQAGTAAGRRSMRGSFPFYMWVLNYHSLFLNLFITPCWALCSLVWSFVHFPSFLVHMHLTHHVSIPVVCILGCLIYCINVHPLHLLCQLYLKKRGGWVSLDKISLRGFVKQAGVATVRKETWPNFLSQNYELLRLSYVGF